MNRAAAAFQKKDFRQAERLCRSVLATDPANASALHLMAVVARQVGDPVSAEQYFRASLELDPMNSEARTNFANLLRSSGRLKQATDQLRMALEINGANRIARLTLARILVDIGSFREAENAAGLLIGRDGNDSEAWATLAVARQRQGAVSEAETAFRSALTIRPDYAVARHNFGAFLCQTHRPEEALHELAHAERLGASSPELYYNRGSAYFEMARFTEAEAALVQAIELQPDFKDAQVLLARLRHMLGDKNYTRDLKQTIRRTSDSTLQLALGDLLRRGGRLDEAESIVRPLYERHPGVPEIESNLAVVLQEMERLPEAERHARSAWKRKPESPELVENFVAILLQLGEHEEAWPLILQQRQRHPLDQRWLAYLATAARLAGRPEHRELYDYARFVRWYDLEPPDGFSSMQAFNHRLADYLRKWHALKTHPLEQSLRQGTQTTRDLLSDREPVIRAFIEALAKPLAAYRVDIGFEIGHPFLARNDGELTLVGCWSVNLTRGGYHVNHIHPQGWISSAYYVEVPSEVANEETRSGWLKFGEPQMPVPGLDAEFLVQPAPGRLVLFPSYMWHGTVPIQESRPRMTIAFDAAPILTLPAVTASNTS